MAGRRETPVVALRALVLALAVVVGAGCSSGADPATSSKKEARRGERGEYAALPPVIAPVARTVRVPVLTYHRVNTYETERQKSVPDLTVEPEVFEGSMAALKRRGFRSITIRQLYDALFRGQRLPPKPVLITVDDGYRDAVTNVLPVLRRHGMVATFFPITERLGGEEYLTREELRGLDAAGMEIGGHTSSHRDLTTLSEVELRREIAGSRRKLARILGHPVYFFAYPFGRYDAKVVAAVERAGYSVAFTTERGSWLSSTARLMEPRIHVRRTATPERVVALAEGDY